MTEAKKHKIMKNTQLNTEAFVKSNLERVNKYVSTLKHKDTLKGSRLVCKQARPAFIATLERLNNNLNNEQLTGVHYSKAEAEALGITTGEGFYSVFYAITRNHIAIIKL